MSFWEQHFNLRKKEEEKNNTLVFELSVSYLSTSIHSAPGLHHPRTACDYLHPSEMIKTQVSKSNVTVCCSYTGALCTRFCDGASAWRIKRFKKVLFIKASLIQKNNYNKKSSPDITLKTMVLPQSYTKTFLFSPLSWNLSPSSWVAPNAGGLFAGQCSTSRVGRQIWRVAGCMLFPITTLHLHLWLDPSYPPEIRCGRGGRRCLMSQTALKTSICTMDTPLPLIEPQPMITLIINRI